MSRITKASAALLGVLVLAGLPGCGWRGMNSLPLPGTQGQGADSFTIEVQLPDVSNLPQNSRVRVGDVNVGTVSKIERQGWNALLTITLDGDVDLPANSTATLGQTSLLGSLHVELAPPVNVPPEGRLRDGAFIPLADSGAYPSTEQTLAAAAMLLNGGGIGRVHDITAAMVTAFTGREDNFRSMLTQLDTFTANLNGQTDEIITATESFDRLVGQFADQKPVIDKALDTIPDALAVVNDQREHLVEAVDQVREFSGLAADSVTQTKEGLVAELQDVGPVLKSLADSGTALTRSLGLFTTYPFVQDTLSNWFRGDYANITLGVDLTLSRLDASFFTGTRWEGNLTELEMQWGRTIGVLPSPYTGGNPLLAPYRTNQGP